MGATDAFYGCCKAASWVLHKRFTGAVKLLYGVSLAALWVLRMRLTGAVELLYGCREPFLGCYTSALRVL